MKDDVTLRPATADDEPFLRAVYASTRADELALTDWSKAQKTQFCDAQFTAQDTHYRQHFPDSQFLVIQRSGVPAGRLYLNREEGRLHIIDIAILPEHRRAGIGSRLLCGLQTEAASTGRPLTIHVEKFNPALHLYERLGFRPIEDKGVYLLMEWRAESS